MGRIRQISQNELTKMAGVATSIVQEAVRRARARRTADDRYPAPEGQISDRDAGTDTPFDFPVS